MYISTVAAKILKYDLNNIVEIYNNLVIKSRKDLKISFLEIKELIGDNNFEKTKIIEESVIENVVNNKLENNYNKIVNFIKQGMNI